MSRHFAAYFAIVGTLAFAPSSAANAGPFNMPHFNMAQPHFNMAQPHFNMLRPQPHFNILRPQISMPTPHLSYSQNHTGKPTGKPTGPVRPELSAIPGPTGQPVPQQQSATGITSANLASNVSGANVSGGAAPSRFRVIEDGGSFAVVERRSDTVIKAGFESSKAAWAWIANHV